jgi:3-oxoacyl-[acyl-carrier-protein] synthase II
MNRRVAITGLGAVTPLGNDVETTWAGLISGRSGIGPITTFDVGTFPVQIGGMVRDFEVASYLPSPGFDRHFSRAAGFGFAAADQAMRQADPAQAYQPHECGIVMGASAGRPEQQELGEIMAAYDRAEVVPQGPTSLLLRQQNVGVEAMARRWRLEGPMVGVSTACSASTHAIGEAFRHIQEGDAKLMVTGGYDALTTWLDVLGFTLLGALAEGYNDDPERASRPFDKNRIGFVLAEGAVVLVLEDLAAAQARGATVLAEVVGYGTTLNAYRITDAPPDGTGPIQSMERALTDAGLAVTSPKSMTGHLTAASGALNALIGVRAIQTGIVPPTINLDTPDPRLDLDYVPNKARYMEVRAVVANAFAFGGTNGTLVLREYSDGRP